MAFYCDWRCENLLEFINHREIFPRDRDLPTFNSHAVEANIHRIDGLSQQYIYLNDDFFFGRTMSLFSFFDEYGRSRYFVWDNMKIPGGDTFTGELAGNAAAKNARRLIEKKFGVYVMRKFLHTPIAINRSVIEEMEQEFPEEFARTSRSRLRQITDVAVSGSFYFHYGTCVGKASEGKLRHRLLNINSDAFPERFAKTLGDDNSEAERFDTFCINDIHTTQSSLYNESVFKELSARAYPIASPFESNR